LKDIQQQGGQNLLIEDILDKPLQRHWLNNESQANSARIVDLRESGSAQKPWSVSEQAFTRRLAGRPELKLTLSKQRLERGHDAAVELVPAPGRSPREPRTTRSPLQVSIQTF
jgi:hypothetical protein